MHPVEYEIWAVPASLTTAANSKTKDPNLAQAMWKHRNFNFICFHNVAMNIAIQMMSDRELWWMEE